MKVPRLSMMVFAMLVYQREAVRQLGEVNLNLSWLGNLPSEMIRELADAPIVESQERGWRREVHPRVHPVRDICDNTIVIVARTR